MVLSRRYIQSVEIHWLLLVLTWKTCVAFGLHHTSSYVSIAGSGKSVLWFAPPPTLSTLVKLTILFQFLNYTRYHSLARCWEGLDGLFLL
jgi:hypothetical protein